ncbi:hypothetical protein JAAARDRAFT_195068 [Jaapia argillacea MUCL 33604]|uniref:F-box domain-containing protein n=1 Tax=Jaapia argillacea MUCL 33604 TaxID=933084 RepID=A0A067Q1H8_9AGAM|nr:hypothetical protein JAAARDRAFT_195068 [Jaapia argillacea MUCL 33604]
MTAITALPTEIHGIILSFPPLNVLLSAHQVNSVWRSLVPTSITNPLRRRLFQLAYLPWEDNHGQLPSSFLGPKRHPLPLSLETRRSYTEYIERTYSIRIPDEYRIVLTEWPWVFPPRGMNWPHAVRFFDDPTTGCTCDRRPARRGSPMPCSCKDDECCTQQLIVSAPLLDQIHEGKEFDDEEEEWGDMIFDLDYDDELGTQRRQTLRLLQSYTEFHPPLQTGKPPTGVWVRNSKESTLTLRVLDLAANFIHEPGRPYGRYFMILEGKARGQIHTWVEFSYGGFEAECFFEWRSPELANTEYLICKDPFSDDESDEESDDEEQEEYVPPRPVLAVIMEDWTAYRS